MTAAETERGPAAQAVAEARPSWRKHLAYGTGVAIEIAGSAREHSLEVAVVQVRPGGSRVLRQTSIQNFRERPAAEWANEFRAAVNGHDTAGVAVLLPRCDVIVRHVQLPGIAQRELASALALRLRALHPFAEDDVAWCWASVSSGALVGLVRLSVLGRYESLFAEAGIPVASFTFSATVLYCAMRLQSDPAAQFLGLTQTSENVVEAYGENSPNMIFSGEFSSVSRATAAGAAELRLPPGAEAYDLAQLLPGRPLLHAAAVTAACPLLLKPANFLPPERRAGQPKFWLIPTAVLATLLLLTVIAVFAIGPWSDRRYMATLHDEIARVKPVADRVANIDALTAHARTDIQTLDNFKARSRADFDVLNELTRLIAPPAWTSGVEIFPDYVIVAGQAEQAAPLLKILDSSPLFQNSEFTNSVSRTTDNFELFRIKTYRRKR